MLTRLGMQEGEAIESKMVSRRIEGAQKKVEERNFDIRKNLLEYDEVMDEQRKRVYSFRQSLLEGAPPKDKILEMIDSQIRDAAESVPGRRLRHGQLRRVGLAAAGHRRHPARPQGRHVRGRRGDRPAPRPNASSTTRSARPWRKTSPPDADPSEWTWLALANWANTRFDLNLKEKDLRKFARQDGEEFEFGRDGPRGVPAREGHRLDREVDLTPAREFLEPDWGRRSLAGWAHHKFGAGHRSRIVGRARPDRGRPPAPGQGPQALRASKRPSCRCGSP